MKKLFFVLLLAYSICLADNYDFRQVNWGMNKSEVIEAEKGLKQVKKLDFMAIPKENIAFSVELFGEKVTLQYVFNNEDCLVMAYYTFPETPTRYLLGPDPYQYYIGQYIKLKELLSKKYGIPAETERWNNETYKNIPASTGEHIAKRHLKISAVWETERTVIILNCMSFMLNHPFHRNRIVYYDRKYYQALDQSKPATETDLNDL